jgi:hypothetical protein
VQLTVMPGYRLVQLPAPDQLSVSGSMKWKMPGS